MSILVVGLSHRTAPVEVRDGVAIAAQDFRVVLKRMSNLPGVSECAMISTCNRTEVHLVAEDPDVARDGAVGVLCDLSQQAPDVIRRHLFVYQDMEAVRHLFEVASGLDSMIMGEPQIAGQVKDAGALAMEIGSSKTVVNRLFRSAVEASKRARTETEIGVGAVSVSFAAVELAKKILGNLDGRTALVVGAGEMSELTATHLVENGVRSLMVASRTHSRAQELAERVNGQALAWQDAMDNLHRADIVISSTSAPVYILRKDAVAGAMQRRRNQPMFLIDIAVPRDIEPAVGELYNVFLYDIDDLQTVVGANLQKRQGEAEKARVLLEEELAAFQSWLNSLEVVPAITALRRYFQETMEAELDRAKLSDFTEEQKTKVAGLLRLYMNKLLHQPQTRLKAAADSGDGMAYVEALAHLFDLSLEEKREKNPEEPDILQSQVEKVEG